MVIRRVWGKWLPIKFKVSDTLVASKVVGAGIMVAGTKHTTNLAVASGGNSVSRVPPAERSGNRGLGYRGALGGPGSLGGGVDALQMGIEAMDSGSDPACELD